MKQHTNRFVELCADARTRVNECSIDEVKQKLFSHEPFFLVDVREESEWTQGHLPNAIHLSKGIIERDIEKFIPDCNATIVLYCGGGYRSALAADNLAKMGYSNVSSMWGGFGEWIRAGYEVEK